MLDDAKLNALVADFVAPRAEFDGKSYVTRRREWFDRPMERVRPLLDRARLARLSIEEAQRLYKEMTVGGPRLYPRTFVENGVERIRESLIYLLYGAGDLAARFYDFAGNPDSPHRLSGVGRAFASTALFLLDHRRNAIWNSAVDGGLEILGLLPTRPPGAHLGEQYVQVVDALLSLQARCAFEDLSVTDEFVELIFHEKLGKESDRPPVAQPEIRPPTEEAEPGQDEGAGHLRIQYLLARMGRMRGYDVWVAANDRGRSFQGQPLASLALEELPHFAGPSTLRVAKSIDIIWFKPKSAQPICFFEIEHSTSIYSGLLRLNDVITDYPVPKAFIVAPVERKGLFDSQIARRTFVHSELADVCQFMSYGDVEKLLTSHETIGKLLF